MGTKPTEAQWTEIEQLLSSGKSVTASCKKTGIEKMRFYHELATDELIATRIARARDIGCDARIDECGEIADDATPEDFQVARLRIWERQWAAAKMKPKKYGDRTQVDQTTKLEAGDTLTAFLLAQRNGK